MQNMFHKHPRKKVIETNYILTPILSVINHDIERDFIPMVKRVLFARFCFVWIPIRRQYIRKILNEYITVSILGGELDYTSHWHPSLKTTDQIIRN